MSQNDTLFRHLAILQILPRAPGYLSTTSIQLKLEEQGYKVTARSIQRDLDKLSARFPLVCQQDSKPYRWSYVADYRSDLPTLDPQTALALALTEDAVKGLLPKVVTDRLDYQFEKARKLLGNLPDNRFARWSHRVRTIPNGKSLLPAKIKPGIWDALTDALLNEQAVDVNYLSRFKGKQLRFTLHPLGLVTRDASSYLLATVNDYEDIRQFALHRFRTVKPSSQPYRPRPDFNVQQHIDQSAFGYPLSQQPVWLVARITTDLAWLLRETPLSRKQILSEPDPDGWVRLEAVVPNDRQTQWWIMGFGASIDVLEPVDWRDYLLQQAREIAARG